jgi:protein O-mannosyl-transferase
MLTVRVRSPALIRLLATHRQPLINMVTGSNPSLSSPDPQIPYVKTAPTSEDLLRQEKLQRWIYLIVLLIAGGVVYHNSLQGPFIFDDPISISLNPNIKSLWPIWQAMGAPDTAGTAGRPVINLTLAINYALGGEKTLGYHVVNLAIHLAAALTLFGIVRRTLLSPALREQFAGRASHLALAVALIWEVHPLVTESVTYIIQRTESLMGLFFLLTLYCSIRARDSEHPMRWYVAAVIACILGMGSKEVMAVAPLIVILYDRIFVFPSYGEMLRRQWKFYAALACTLLLVPRLLFTVVSLRSKTGAGLEVMTAWTYALTQAGVLVHYLHLSFWPTQLCIDYYDWPKAKHLSDVLPQALIIVGLLAATIYALFKHQTIGFLGLWFFLILAPTSSFLPLGTEIAAERRMYLPLIAIVALVVFAVDHVLQDKRLEIPEESIRWIGLALLVVTSLGLGYLTFDRNEDYATDTQIYSDAVAKRPHNTRALTNLGGSLSARGFLQDAIDIMRHGLQFDPNAATTHRNLAKLLEKTNDLDGAVIHYTFAVVNDSGNISYYMDLARAYVLKKDYDRALFVLDQALQNDPNAQNVISYREQVLAMRAGATTQP